MYNNNKNKDELDTLMQLFSKKESEPSHSFEKELAEKINTSFNTNPKNYNLFLKLLHMKRWLMAGLLLTGFMFVALVISIPTVYLISKNRNSSKQILVALSDDEKKNLLKSFAKNNASLSTGLQNKNSESAAKLAAGPTRLDAEDESYDNQDVLTSFFSGSGYLGNEEYNYSHSKITTNYGPAIDKCENYLYGAKYNSTNETWSYSDINDYRNSYSKSITTDDNGELTEYYSNFSGTNIIYYGGDYAVKQIYPIVDSEDTILYDTSSGATSELQTTDAPVEKDIDFTEMFGDDISVEKVMEGDKIVNYIITINSQGYCSNGPIAYIGFDEQGKIDDNSGEKFINKIWLNPENLQMQRDETYLDNTNSDSLLITTYFEIVEQKNVELDSVLTTFTEFPYDVEVKTYDMADSSGDYSYEKELDTSLNYIRDNGINLLASTDSNYQFTSVYRYVYEVPEWMNYMFDRNFYYKGKYGDLIFKFYNQSNESTYTEPDSEVGVYLTNSSTPDTYYAISYNVYKTGTNIEEILKNRNYNNSNASGENFTINIDGSNVQGKLYKLEYPEAILYSTDTSSDSNSSGEAKNITTFYLSIEYKGYIYLIQLEGYNSKEELNSLSLKSIDMSIQSNIDTIRTTLLSYQNQVVEEKVEPRDATENVTQ